LVAFGGASNGDQSFVAVVLWLVDLDHTATELSDLVDLCTTLANDGSDHIVWDEDLLGQRLTRDDALHRLDWWTTVRLRTSVASCLWLLWPNTSVARNNGRATVVHWHGRLLLRNLTLSIRMAVSVARGVVPTVDATVMIRVAIITTSWLGYVRYYLHSSRDYSSRTAASGSISRCCRPSKPFRKLLKERATNIVGCDVNGISNTKHDK